MNFLQIDEKRAVNLTMIETISEVDNEARIFMKGHQGSYLFCDKYSFSDLFEILNGYKPEKTEKKETVCCKKKEPSVTNVTKEMVISAIKSYIKCFNEKEAALELNQFNASKLSELDKSKWESFIKVLNHRMSEKYKIF